MENTIEQPTHWSAGKKAGFRFLFVLFCLYIVLNPNGVVIINNLSLLYIKFFHGLITWSSAHILHIAKPITIFTNGSGDTTYDYLIILFITIISAISCLIWSALDKKPRNYNKLFYWLTVIVRYYIAITMFNYGFAKIIKLQFPAPGLDRLTEPFGDSSPMGLAWTYMGYSTGFNYFTGFAEVLCGVLLLFRRTSVAGALMGLAVAGNIMAINYAFDVPVKLLSTTLVVMCLFLLSAHATRLINLFFLNKPAPVADLITHNFKKRWKNVTLITLKYLLIAVTIYSSLYADINMSEVYGDTAKKPPLYGLYNVVSFVQNHDTIPPLTTNENRWKRLTVNYAGYAKLTSMTDSSAYLKFKPDTARKQIIAYNGESGKDSTIFVYKIMKNYTKPDQLWIKGKWGPDTLTILFDKYDERHFKLMNRGFHWINEYPNNR